MSNLQSQGAVFIEGYEFNASIGVFEWEKKILQKLIFDLTLYCDFSMASQTDDLEYAIDYVAVCGLINRVTLGKHYQLLESLAEDISTKILDTFPVTSLEIQIAKPTAVAEAKQVGVRIYRKSNVVKGMK